MRLSTLAAYFSIKYAENNEDIADTSLGALINAKKTRILKDKLILVYDRLTKDITRLPAFRELNQKLGDNQYLLDFNNLIINLVNYVESNNLKNIFNYSTQLIEELNRLGNSIIPSKLPREQILMLDQAIRSIQNVIWEESKRILNLHDLRGVLLSFPELKGILDKSPVPTWDHGPGKNPAQSRIRQRYLHTQDLIKRLERENQEEELLKNRQKGK